MEESVDQPGRDADAEPPGFRPLDPRELGAAFDLPPERRIDERRLQQRRAAAPGFTPLVEEHGAAASLICARCGAHDAPPARFCRACGAALDAAPPRRRARPLAFVVVAALALTAAGALVYALRPQAPPAARAARPVAPIASTPKPAAPTTTAPPLTAAAPAPPAETPAGPIADPVWDRQPTPTELWRRYPEQAMNLGLSGGATLDCAVTAEGRLAGCRALDEVPLDHGFAAAALEVAPAFRLATLTRSGAPVAGRRIRVPVHWLIGGKDKRGPR